MTYDTITLNYTYDNQKRLIKFEQAKFNNDIEATTAYDYSQANQVIETQTSKYFPASSYQKVVYNNDANGKVIRSNPRDPVTNVDGSYTRNYTYNVDAQLLEMQDGSSKLTNLYSGGNLIKNTLSTSRQTIENVYEYNTTINNTIDNDRFGKSFLGKNSVNAFSKRTYSVINSGTLEYKSIENVTYEVDSEGYITKSKHVFNWTSNGTSGSYAIERTYFYQ